MAGTTDRPGHPLLHDERPPLDLPRTKQKVARKVGTKRDARATKPKQHNGNRQESTAEQTETKRRCWEYKNERKIKKRTWKNGGVVKPH